MMTARLCMEISGSIQIQFDGHPRIFLPLIFLS
jgi:hypothetical protein